MNTKILGYAYAVKDKTFILNVIILLLKIELLPNRSSVGKSIHYKNKIRIKGIVSLMLCKHIDVRF